MSTIQSNPVFDPFLRKLLKGVSRSFYLSIRILPHSVQKTVSVAYLLARAADTLSDTTILSAEKRIQFLKDFRKWIQENYAQEPQNLSSLLQDLKKHEHEQEKELIQNLSPILKIYQDLPPSHKKISQKVLLTLTRGMLNDLEYFPQEKFNHKNGSSALCLKTEKDTEQYTYLVAGCVGEFWSNLLIEESLYVGAGEELIQYGTQFGKGLQMINILRDLPKDLAIGRCYLAEEDFGKHAISFHEMVQFCHAISKNGSTPAEPPWMKNLEELYEEKIQKTRNLLASGMKYALSFPRRFIRLRLAALWPLMIGLDTLTLLENTPIRMKLQNPLRIHRNQVYRMMAFTATFAPCNSLLLPYYRKKMRHSL